MVDHNDATHKEMLTAGALSAPAADAAFGGAKSLIYTGSQRSVSNRASSAWKSESDGTGGTRIVIWAPIAVSITQVFVATAAPGGTGAWLAAAATAPATAVLSGGSIVVNAFPQALLVAGVGVVATTRYTASAWDFRVAGAVIASGGATAPSASAPDVSLTVGSDGAGTNPAQMRFRACYDFRRVLTAPELAIAAAYVLQTTGLVL